MFMELRDIDIKVIDKLLWLSSPVFKRCPQKHEDLYNESVQIGRNTAEQFPVDPGSIQANFAAIGVRGIKYFQQAGGDRAYYLPEEQAICINDLFVAEMAEYFLSQEMAYFTQEKVKEALILHELFHHIEETLTTPTDSLLRSRRKVFVPPIYRDIAAFAFVNACIPGMVCQVIDVFWFKKEHPQKYEEIEKRVKAGGLFAYC